MFCMMPWSACALFGQRRCDPPSLAKSSLTTRKHKLDPQTTKQTKLGSTRTHTDTHSLSLSRTLSLSLSLSRSLVRSLSHAHAREETRKEAFVLFVETVGGLCSREPRQEQPTNGCAKHVCGAEPPELQRNCAEHGAKSFVGHIADAADACREAEEHQVLGSHPGRCCRLSHCTGCHWR